MEIKVLHEKQNPLLKRKEFEGSVHSDKAPSKLDVLHALSKKFSSNIESIKVKEITGKFGTRTFTIKANIYHSKEDKDKVEYKRKREIELDKKLAEANKPAEAPAE